KRTKSPNVGPSNADGIRPESECFEHVRSTSKPSIDQYGNASANGLRHLRDAFNGSAARLGSPPPMVGNNDSVSAMLDGLRRIFASLKSLDDNLHFGDILQPLDEVPRQRWRCQSKPLSVDSREHGFTRIRSAAHLRIRQITCSVLVAAGAIASVL